VRHLSRSTTDTADTADTATGAIDSGSCGHNTSGRRHDTPEGIRRVHVVVTDTVAVHATAAHADVHGRRCRSVVVLLRVLPLASAAAARTHKLADADATNTDTADDTPPRDIAPLRLLALLRLLLVSLAILARHDGPRAHNRVERRDVQRQRERVDGVAIEGTHAVRLRQVVRHAVATHTLAACQQVGAAVAGRRLEALGAQGA
jgi:hypothetical protein